MKLRIVKSPQARSDICNNGNVAVKHIYAKEVIADLVNYNFPFGLNEIFLAHSVSM